MRHAITRAWDADGAGAALLAPLSWLFGFGVAARNAAYDRGFLRSHALGLPAVSIGNLSVGGTGKTPVAAWVARWFSERGIRPAILLRGYGDDEPLVHAELAPGAIVVADADRVAGATRAKAQGAHVLVLDDAFQHRRAHRDVDVVIVAAEQGRARRLLPAGPLRERRSALARAHALVVTRKSASREDAEAVARAWAPPSRDGAFPTAVVHLAPRSLLRVATSAPAGERPLAELQGERVVAVSAIGDPTAFEAQLRAVGAEVEPARFPDHHAFTDDDVARLARRAEGSDGVVCTLKDAVKLRSRWPAFAPPFWYLSQAVTWERGEAILTDLLSRLTTPDTPR